jgi:hypothetical protein
MVVSLQDDPHNELCVPVLRHLYGPSTTWHSITIGLYEQENGVEVMERHIQD